MEAIREKLGLGQLWDLYGVVGDVEVSANLSQINLLQLPSSQPITSRSHMTSPAQIFTSCFPPISYINSSRGRSKTTWLSG
jgi:hypothetical protein